MAVREHHRRRVDGPDVYVGRVDVRGVRRHPPMRIVDAGADTGRIRGHAAPRHRDGPFPTGHQAPGMPSQAIPPFPIRSAMSDTVRGWRGRRDRRPWPCGRRLARQGGSCPSCARHADGSGPTMCHPVSSEAARPGHRRDRSSTGARSDVRFQTLRVTGARAQRRRRASGSGPCAPSSVPVARCGGDHVVECAVRSAAHRSPFRPGPAEAASSPGSGHPYRPSGPDDRFFHHPSRAAGLIPASRPRDTAPTSRRVSRPRCPLRPHPASRILAARRRRLAQTPPDPWRTRRTRAGLAHGSGHGPRKAALRSTAP